VRSAIAFGVAALCHALAHGQAGPGGQLRPVQVIDTTPLPGIGQPRDEVPAPVQSTTARDLQRSGAPTLPDFVNRELGSVFVNELQGNPYQPDVSYRGYTASPLLGTPQGLSVYMDGVRMNQPFGDVVGWDLMPRSAIASISLMPGSNPLFGLNTLGGALSIQTKDGRSHPGSSVTTYAGSYGRRAVEFEHGGFNDRGLSWFLTGNLFKERGWREESPSDVRQLFGKLGWRGGGTDAKLTLAYADNQLYGNGLQDNRLLAANYAGIYTKPDITQNQSLLVNLALSRTVDASTLVSGNVYYRRLNSTTLNADINEGSLNQSVYQPSAADRAALAAAGYSGYPASGANAGNTPFPYWRCIAQALQNDEPGEKCNGLINRTHTDQESLGASGQVTVLGELAGRRNQLTLGAAADASRTRFVQTQQLGFLNADRSVTGVAAFADGVTGGNVDGQPLDSRVDLDGRVRTLSLYATDTLSFGDAVHLTLSGRFNHTRVRNRDAITPGGGADSLDGDHAYSRFNPAIGLTWSPNPATNAYVGYSESSRAPTAIELGCANPANPCKLPNAMAGDPPLRQVVAKTFEAGLRGTLPGNLRWNAGVFRAENTDDILFVADNQAGFGYFKNFGQTRRQGIELGLSGRAGRVAFGTSYTFLDATYQSAETVNGSGNSSNSAAAAGVRGVDGTIAVKPGDRIPLIPRQMFKAHADYAFSDAASVGLGMVAMSSMLARGNENGQHQADGVYYLGPGRTAGYAVFNLAAAYRPSKPLRLFLQVSNLFDRRYATGAQLGPTGLTAAGTYIARPFAAVNGDFPVQHATFVAPGAPRMIWLGLTYTFGG
jgi:outer membrane receptor protein involved in Fe transport